MMNKLAIVFLTAAMALGSTATIAAENTSNNGSADATAPDVKQSLQHNDVDSSKTSDASTPHKSTQHHKKSSNKTAHKHSSCKEEKCADTRKMDTGADTKTDETMQ